MLPYIIPGSVKGQEILEGYNIYDSALAPSEQVGKYMRLEMGPTDELYLLFILK